MVKKKVWKAATCLQRGQTWVCTIMPVLLTFPPRSRSSRPVGDEECGGLGPSLRVSAGEGLAAERSKTGEKGLPETGIREAAEMTGHKRSIPFFCEGVADGATPL